MTTINPITAPPTTGKGANIVFYDNKSELLKLADNGFYVRGKRLNIDDNEARSVYLAFREFLIWSALVRE